MKPQTLKLVEHLNEGGEVTRDSAWQDFGIQNATARMSELTAHGFALVKEKQEAVIHGRKTTITAWRLRDCLKPGYTVQALKDSGTYLSPKGSIGTVESVQLEKGTATVFFPSIGYRCLPFSHLKRIPHLDAGTRVSIKPAPYVVLDFHPEINSYILTSPNIEHTIVAHANLVEAYAV